MIENGHFHDFIDNVFKMCKESFEWQTEIHDLKSLQTIFKSIAALL